MLCMVDGLNRRENWLIDSWFQLLRDHCRTYFTVHEESEMDPAKVKGFFVFALQQVAERLQNLTESVLRFRFLLPHLLCLC